MLRTISMGRLAAGLTLAVLAVASLPVTTLAADPPIKFDIQLGSPCLTGRATPDATVDVTWRDTSGTLKGQGSVIAEFGHWKLCGGTYDFVAAGDRIRASDGVYTRNYVVPELTIVADRAFDVFYGTGPAGRTIRIEYPAGLFADYTVSHLVRVDQDGYWQFNPTGEIAGGLPAWLYWTSPNKDTLEADTSAASITLTLGKATFRGSTAPGTDLTLTLRDTATNAKLGSAQTVAAPLNGDFGGTFRNAGGHVVRVTPGQHFKSPTLSPDADFVVPNIDGSADPVTDVVTGRCYDASLEEIFHVFVSRGGQTRGYLLFASFDDGDGNFTVDFGDLGDYPGSDRANIQSGDRVEIDCMQRTGDWVTTSFRVR